MPGTQSDWGGGRPFLSIIQGSLRQKVESFTEGAKRRDYELKDGTKGTKFELIFSSWTGKIEDMYVKDSDYGEFLNIEFSDAILKIGVESRYFNDFVHRIAGADLTQEVTLKPYDIEDKDTGKRNVGVSVQQNGVKLKNFFYDAENKVSLHGYPEPEGDRDTYKKDDWKMHFIKVRKFLVAYIEKLEFDKPEAPKDDGIPTINLDDEKEELKIEDVPF